MSTNHNETSTTKSIAPVNAGGWHRAIAFYRAAVAAGFSASPIKEFEARDGIAWSTTLSLGKVKVIEASNGGYGGPDELSYVHPKNQADVAKARAAADAAQATLLAIPEAAAVIRAFDVAVANYGPDKDKVKEEIARIMAAPPRATDETASLLIQELATVRKMLPSLRKKAQTKLIWVRAEDSFPSHITANCTDTPANRAAVQRHHAATFVNFQGYAIDLLAGL